MKRGRGILAAIAVAFFSAACMTPWSLAQRQQRNEALQQQIQKDILNFYENMAQAYYVLAYDCFLLGEEAQTAKNDALAQQYVKRANMYKRYSEDVRESLKATRQAMGLAEPAVVGAAPPAESSAAPAPQATVEPASPALAPTVPPPAEVQPASTSGTSPSATGSDKPRSTLFDRLRSPLRK